ncbi:MAG TPA: NADH-quinone oxidoreductase subunit K [Thermomicrobiales bacterium]|nr:NADH-quinone oxidoreductase subunit K [Thermomicrobiales bacterium]
MSDLISISQASTVIDVTALGLLALGLLSVLVKRLEAAIVLLAGQGILLGVASGAAALSDMGWRSWAAFAVAVAVKVVAIPLILWVVLGRLPVHHDHDVESVVPVKLAFPMAIALVAGAYWVIEPVGAAHIGPHGFDAPNALPGALGLLMIGIFLMATRKRALTQVIGLVTMENAIFLAAVAATHGLPLAVEFGIAMDVLTGVALMALVTHEIGRLLATTDIDRLRTLRG